MGNIVQVPRELINFFRASIDFAGIQRYFQNIDTIIGGTTTSLDDLQVTIASLRGKVGELQKEIDELKQADSLRAKFKELQDAIDDFRKTDSLRSKIKELQDAIEELKEQQRS